ncbi:predicted protein [Verticillium alfalfae VaMs.102]|uniref:Predicted protein n=1 Tax=Verticillium alfalfae (strain VaMs.102 / ATCC MYA-4576 / FGSC 10136) TaxID=526221 RepID=C9SNK1_VERA1|nr:predicted protein [Verticillium alfalfae VaMs.102]EEY20366.1 predicted protein [Verticillium alfalfae VaMs.102]
MTLHYLKKPAGRATLPKPSANQLGTLPPQSRNDLDYDASVKVQMQRWGKVECGCRLNVGWPTAENPDRFGSFEAAPSTGHHGRGGGGGGSGSGSGSTQAGRAPLSRWWMICSTDLILNFPIIQSLDRDGHAPTSLSASGMRAEAATLQADTENDRRRGAAPLERSIARDGNDTKKEGSETGGAGAGRGGEERQQKRTDFDMLAWLGPLQTPG